VPAVAERRLVEIRASMWEPVTYAGGTTAEFFVHKVDGMTRPAMADSCALEGQGSRACRWRRVHADGVGLDTLDRKVH
jgi:hypothetical protein